MSERRPDYAQEVRDTIVKSGLTGVAATVMAVTAFSPAGFGGIVGTSLASGLGLDNGRASNDPYARLPAFPSPLTQSELSDIRGELARTAASLEITRAATEGKIAYVRSIAEHQGLSAVAPMAHFASAAPQSAAPVAAATTSVASAAPPTVAASAQPGRHDPHMELAALLLAHENL
jgi:hypothetical protein